MSKEIEHLVPPFTIEMKEVGVWWDIEHDIKTLEEALLSSGYANRLVGGEERVRIIDAEGTII